MSHMVIFQTPGGSPGYNQFDSLDDAVAFVEELRNERNVENARMFALEEIKFELRPVFKVELQALNAGPSPVAAPSAPSAPEAPAAAPKAEAPSPQPEQQPAPSAPAAPSAPSAPPSGGFSAPPPSAPAPQAAPSQPAASPEPPAAEPNGDKTDDAPPVRRGLFGR